MTSPALQVEVVHGNLAFSRSAVMVGHFSGVPLSGAEAAADPALGGTITQRQVLLGHPPPRGEGALVRGGPGAELPIALVLGLGDFGTLTAGTLTQACQSAVVKWLADVRESANIPLTTAIVGTGNAGGLPISASVRALVEGCAQALATMHAADPTRGGRLTLRVIELYEDRCEVAFQALRRAFTGSPAATLYSGVHIQVAPNVTLRRGGLPGGPPADANAELWGRLAVTCHRHAEHLGRHELRFVFTSQAASAVSHARTIELDALRSELNSLSFEQSTPTSREALFRLLFPEPLQGLVRESVRNALVVDDTTAGLPWEFADPGGARTLDSSQPAHLWLRQLAAPLTFRPPAGRAGRALVIGDPTGDLPRARDETDEVASLLNRAGFEVVLCMGTKANDGVQTDALLTHLLTKDGYEIVHIAAHGSARSQEPYIQLLPNSRGEPVSLTPDLLCRSGNAPSLVFLNCCEVGRHDCEALHPHVAHPTRGLERGFGPALIERGVRAVIAPSDPVSDSSARDLALAFYAALANDGQDLAQSWAAARAAVREQAPERTWGVYQAYGEPGFRLRRTAPSPHRLQLPRWSAEPGTRAELVKRLQVLAGVATQVLPNDAEPLHTELLSSLAALELRAEAMGLDQTGEVAASLAQLHAELGHFATAVRWYERAFRADDHTTPMRTLEQALNLLGRWIDSLEPDHQEATQAEAKEADLERRLVALVGSPSSPSTLANTERLSILGSLHKRRAARAIRRGAGVNEMRAATRSIQGAVAWYRAAAALAAQHRRGYPLSNAVGLACVRPGSRVAVKELEGFTEQRNSPEQDFFGETGPADAALALALAKPKQTSQWLWKAKEGYTRAFALGASPRQRESVVGHIRILADLCTAYEHPLAPDILALVQRF